MKHERAGTPEQRLEAMEREMRRVRRLQAFALVSLAVFMGVAAAIIAMAERGRILDRSHSILESRRFVLRDDAGRIRGVWEAAEGGAAQIILSDSVGRERLRIRVLEDGSAGLAMVDSLQRSRAVMAVLPDETTALVLADKAGRSRAVLGLKVDGAPSLALADADGSVRSGLGLEGGPSVARRRGGAGGGEPLEEPRADSTAVPQEGR